MSNIVGRVVGFQDRQQNNYRGFYKIVEKNFFANVVSQIINLGLLQVFYNSTTQVSESDFVDMVGDFWLFFRLMMLHVLRAKSMTHSTIFWPF